MESVCIYPKATGGGVGSFRLKFAAGLEQRGIRVSYDLDAACDIVLVLAGTRNIPGLWHAKRRGVPIVQRLDGINWIHRRRRISWKHTLRSEYGNFILSYIRKYLADRIVYQSEFSRCWWDDWYGPVKATANVVHNGVDLGLYSPKGSGQPPENSFRLLVVEGTMDGGYDIGLANAMQLAEILTLMTPVPAPFLTLGSKRGP